MPDRSFGGLPHAVSSSEIQRVLRDIRSREGDVRQAMERRWRTARRLRRDIGLRGVAYVTACSVLPARLVQLEWFVAVERRFSDPGPLPEGVTIRWDEPSDLGLLSSLDLTAQEVERRRGLGDRALICQGGDGRLIGYAWYRRGEWDERGIQFVLGDHEAWCYDLRVAPTREGRRMLGHFGAYSSVAFADEGVTCLLAGIDVANRGVLRSTLRRGSRALGSVAMVRVGGLSLRREDWNGHRPRWRVCRGCRAVRRPAGVVAETPRDDAAAPVYAPARNGT